MGFGVKNFCKDKTEQTLLKFSFRPKKPLNFPFHALKFYSILLFQFDGVVSEERETGS